MTRSSGLSGNWSDVQASIAVRSGIVLAAAAWYVWLRTVNSSGYADMRLVVLLLFSSLACLAPLFLKLKPSSVIAVQATVAFVATCVAYLGFGYQGAAWFFIVPLLLASFALGSLAGLMLATAVLLVLPRAGAAVRDGLWFLDLFYILVAALALFSARALRNALGPLIYLNSMNHFTLALGLNLLRRSAEWSTRWELIMAGSVLSIMPMLLIFFLGQNYFVQGIALTGIKE
jgi:ABC-type glycerol-3-phosphate transport system permease component